MNPRHADVGSVLHCVADDFTMTTDLEVIQAWLQSFYSVQVPPDWLAACTEWIQQENGVLTVYYHVLSLLLILQHNCNCDITDTVVVVITINTKII